MFIVNVLLGIAIAIGVMVSFGRLVRISVKAVSTLFDKLEEILGL